MTTDEDRRATAELAARLITEGLTDRVRAAAGQLPVDLATRYAHRRPDVFDKLRFFDVTHLRPGLQPYALLFAELVEELLSCLPDDDELVEALDKLREAKDRAVALAAQIEENAP